MFSFANPEFLYLLFILPAVVGLFLLDRWARKRKLERFGRQKQLQELMPDVSSRKPVARLVIILLLLATVIVMLARPRAGSMERIKGEVQGIEVVIAIDISNSMNASSTANNNDLSRLNRAKMVMEKLIDRMHNDKVGLVVFAGKAMMQMPMTIDGSSAKMFLKNISTDMMPLQGTNIADAINLSMHAFSQDEKVSRTIILITDAENFEGDAVEAAKKAHKKNIQVNVIGIGSSKVPIPTNEGQGWMLDDNGEIAMTSFNEDQAQEIAKAGGGMLIKGDATDAVETLDKSLKKLSEGNLSQYSFSREDEQFPVFAWIALLLLIASIIMLNHKNPWLAKKNFFRRKVNNNNEEE